VGQKVQSGQYGGRLTGTCRDQQKDLHTHLRPRGMEPLG
jgi:hypothetical protein